MTRQANLSDLIFQPFSKKFEADLTRFHRREFFNYRAILKETVKAPFSYFFIGILSVILWSTSLASIPIAIVTATITTGLISMSIMKVLIIYHDGFDGTVYPQRIVNSYKGQYIIVLDTMQEPTEIVGTIAIGPRTDNNTGLLTRYCVKSDYRGIGIGKRLLSMALEHCEKVGFHSVEAECWQACSLNPVLEIFKKLDLEWNIYITGLDSFRCIGYGIESNESYSWQ
ncbi:hypothetical protein BSL78_13654 [Apostichopus japonicus]|uniref:N-acetyltransferase domain-containing protein n=1 Tax=Stichopus japonicus TaxID=307972 RepID=A0A2G8KN82_STIJA|nr:hypothetical protein BSL78_13654 [Apostichopus japonicus]